MLCASSENAKKRLEAIVEARGGYIEDNYFFPGGNILIKDFWK